MCFLSNQIQNIVAMQNYVTHFFSENKDHKSCMRADNCICKGITLTQRRYNGNCARAGRKILLPAVGVITSDFNYDGKVL